MITVGYFEYASTLLFEKDQFKTKLLIDPKLKQPVLSSLEETAVIALPRPNIDVEDEISFIGYRFPASSAGKVQVARLFKACVFHLSAHVVVSKYRDYDSWRTKKDTRLARFSESLVEDAKVKAYIQAQHSDAFEDITFADSLASRRVRSLDVISIPATRVMTASLQKINMGMVKGELSADEQETVSRVADKLGSFEVGMVEALKDEQVDKGGLGLKVVDNIYQEFEGYCPILEVPSLPHTERVERCTVFPSFMVQLENGASRKHLGTRGRKKVNKKLQHTMQAKADEAEALQVFDSWLHEEAKREKVLGRYEQLLPLTRFRSIAFPDEDYTEYLKKKTGIRSRTRRLTESLMVAFDALDEDPRKLCGVLDLQDTIQVMASRSPRTDVFMQEENISKSYAWIILLDASRSMRVVGDFARNLGICLAETARELLIDPTSWGLYAFNDRFLVLKDMQERYGARIKARIGGLQFEGLTFMPDALKIAENLLKKRCENLRMIAILSDGWPYGYSDITDRLMETLASITKAGIAVVGMGVRSNRMKNYFRVNCNVENMKRFTRDFGNIYAAASRSAAGL